MIRTAATANGYRSVSAAPAATLAASPRYPGASTATMGSANRTPTNETPAVSAQQEAEYRPGEPPRVLFPALGHHPGVDGDEGGGQGLLTQEVLNEIRSSERRAKYVAVRTGAEEEGQSRLAHETQHAARENPRRDGGCRAARFRAVPSDVGRSPSRRPSFDPRSPPDIPPKIASRSRESQLWRRNRPVMLIIMEPEKQLAEVLDEVGSGFLLVVTGAGVSSGSGLATFRGTDAGAVWKNSDIALATYDYFSTDPAGHWSWYLDRFSTLHSAVPNPAHRALAELERWHEDRGGRFLLVTQNIDTLHEAAGSRHLIKVHGTSDRVRCPQAGCRQGAPRGSLPFSPESFAAFEASGEADSLPTCPDCDSVLRAHVLLFDEYYTEHVDYRFREVQQAADEATAAIFIGTSFAVGVTDLLLRSFAARGIPALSIDPGANPPPSWSGVVHLSAPAEELLPRVGRNLGFFASNAPTDA